MTGAIPFCHFAVAAGVKKSTCQKIIQKVVDALIENGFISKWITRITEEEARYEAELFTRGSGMPPIFPLVVDGSHVEVS